MRESKLNSLTIFGLFDRIDVTIDFLDGRRVLIGPNGYGKTTILNIVFFTLSRQWSKLAEEPFARIAVHIDNEVYEFEKQSLFFMGSLRNRRYHRAYELLRSTPILKELRESSSITEDLVRRVSFVTRTPPRNAREIIAFLRNDVEGDLFTEINQKIEIAIKGAFPSRFYYLPTYRRIEKDIGVLFPQIDSEAINQARYQRRQVFSETVTEIIQFGMDDVNEIFEDAMGASQSYSHAQLNGLAGSYLKNVILQSDHLKSHSEVDFRRLLDDTNSSLRKVNKNILNPDEKERVLQLVNEISAKSRPTIGDQYVLSYVRILNEATKQISENDNRIKRFTEVVNEYLSPSKRIIFDDIGYSLTVCESSGKSEISLSALSSGEKQIVSLFSHIYLANDKDFYIFIDEPELSLSVPWQKRFLEDISNHPKCKVLLSVTHSPFIWENSMENSTLDIRKLVHYYE